MRIKLEKVGLVNKAEIKIDGITIIAGINDSGKSTIGKAIYAGIKSFNSSATELNTSSATRIDVLLMFTRLDLIKIAENHKYETLPLLTRSISNYRKSLAELINEDRTLEAYDSFLSLKSEILTFLDKKKIPDELDKKIDARLSRIESLLIPSSSNTTSNLQKKFNQILNSSFGVFSREEIFQDGNMEFYFDSDDEIISFNSMLENENKITSENIHLLEKKFPAEVTLIESPYVLGLFEQILKSRTIQESIGTTPRRAVGTGFVPHHQKDLIQKLMEPKALSLPEELQDIDSIIEGEFAFDRKSRNFIYTKKKVKFNLNSTATGVKSLGLLKILLEAGFAENGSLLILDEPEVHLHPEWQIKFAHFIVKVANLKKCKFLISSHSPFFIEALEVFSRNVEVDLNIYLMDKSKGKLKARDCTQNVEEIYLHLTTPLEKLDEEKNDN